MEFGVGGFGSGGPIQGKAWPDGQAEPGDWMLTLDEPQAPRPGRAGCFATPYSGTAVRFDDVQVTANSK